MGAVKRRWTAAPTGWTFTAVWRQLSPEVERIVDYRPCGQTEPQPLGIAERIDTMPAWQILNVLLYQFDAAKIY